MPRLRPSAAAALAATLLALTGCGTGSPDSGRPNESAALLLDAHPNGLHAGIYLALSRDFTGAEGVTLQVQIPGAGTKPITNLTTRRAQFAIVDIHEFAAAQEAGADVVAVLAIADEPLAAVVPRATKLTPDPGARRVPGTDLVAGAAAYFRAAGLDARPKLAGSRVLRAGDRGTPAYPELLLVTTHATVDDDPALVRATVTALQRGYHAAVNDPESAVGALTSAVPGLDRDRAAKQLDAVSPAFQAPSGLVGTLDLDALRTWAQWERRIGAVPRVPEVANMFLPRFAAAGARKALEDDG